MSRFTPRERANYLAIKAACYSGLGTAELLAAVGDRLYASCEADATCMVQLDPASTLPIYFVSHGWTEEEHRPLADHALLASPGADPGRLIASRRRVVDVEKIMPQDRPYYRDPYFEHHILLGGYRHEVQAVCAAKGRGQALLTVSRRAASGSFEPRHLRLLDAIAPHVAAGMRAAVARETAIAYPTGSTGLVLLDATGNVELANATGERWLSGTGLSERPGRLWVIRVLAGLLQRSLTDEGATTVPEIEIAEPVTGALHRLQAQQATSPDGTPRTIILIEPARGADRPETLIRLGLSQREAEVALAILRGASIESIAAELCLSPHTVIQHRRNTFMKLDVSSRRELMDRLMGRW